MRNIKFCIIVSSIREDNLVCFPDEEEKYFYFHESILTAIQPDDIAFIIYTAYQKVYHALFTGINEVASYNRLENEWLLDDRTSVEKEGIYRKLRILDQADLMPGNEPDASWEINKVSSLSPEDADKVDFLLSCFENDIVSASLRYLEHPNEVELHETHPVSHAVFDFQHRQLLMAIKTKPFVLLAGISGIGKSRLIRELAYKTCFDEALQHPEKPGNFELIQVKPNWHDSSEIIGYVTYRGDRLRYHVPAFLHFVVKAWKYLHVPFFLCLDEMNLGKVEQYFAEYLSILESRHFVNHEIFSDSFISGVDLQLYAQEYPLLWQNLGLDDQPHLRSRFLKYGITLPPNLVVAGTVNMDATTNRFSRKVLDRAMTIEMNTVSFMKGLDVHDDAWQYPEQFILADLLQRKFYDVNEIYNADKQMATTIITLLEQIDTILVDSPFRIAYRVRNEFLIYCACNKEIMPEGNSPEQWLNTCIDEMIVMKILSRIEGNESKCTAVLDGLLQAIPGTFPASHQKLQQMKKRLTITSYTSFWN